MKIVIAIDSFKGSLTSLQAGSAAAEGIARVYPQAQTEIFPIADGGEGTVIALTTALNGKLQSVEAMDPLGRPITCEYGILPGQTAVIEMSCAAGITLLSAAERDPMKTTTYGVGQVIADAISRGCRDFIVGIGGSATNDGGIGMLQALGFGILDETGAQVALGGAGLEKIAAITAENALPELSDCTFRIACDVTNPLCGELGCSAIYGPQKGADPEMIRKMDGWLGSYADKVKTVFPHSDKNMPGAGAAGGIGFAFFSFLGGKPYSGIDLILGELRIEDTIRTADLVITGEGRLDAQTVMGKAPIGIAKIAKKYRKPVIAFSGCVTPEAGVCNTSGIDAFFPIVKGACSLEAAMDVQNAYPNMADTAEQVFRLLKMAREGAAL
ncbi:MAG: glycerate kinase [Oscillospiraceae bacterium]|nr:glycerate kinase [Oscillospiraceae bacterium]